QRDTNAVAASSRRDPLAAEDLPLCERRISRGEVEPGLSALRLPLRPPLRRRNGRRGTFAEQSIVGSILWVDLNPPPHRDHAEHLAGFCRARRTGVFQLFVGTIESGIENRFVDGGQ